MKTFTAAGVSERSFRLHYVASGPPHIVNLPMGCILGTVVVEGCREIDSEFMEDLEAQE
jgi:hypothetical protein